MPIIIGEGTTPYYKRKIKCPAHYLIHPKVDIYKREPIPEFKDCHNIVEYQGKPIRIRKQRIVKDAFGNKVIDWKKLYELGEKNDGSVIQPWVSASWAIENCYNPSSIVCLLCKRRCFEGKQTIIERTIQRLYPTKDSSSKIESYR